MTLSITRTDPVLRAIRESNAIRRCCNLPPLTAEERKQYKSSYEAELAKKIDHAVLRKNEGRALAGTFIMMPTEETNFRKHLRHPDAQMILFFGEEEAFLSLLASGLERDNWKFPKALKLKGTTAVSASR